MKVLHPKLKITKYLNSVLSKVSKEKKNNQSPIFKNYKDAIKWLDSQK